MKKRIGLAFLVTLALFAVSCSAFSTAFSDPLVGTWNVTRSTETESITFTDSGDFTDVITSSSGVLTWTGTYTSNERAINFQYQTRNGSPYSCLNVINYEITGDQLWLCWDSTGTTYTKQ